MLVIIIQLIICVNYTSNKVSIMASKKYFYGVLNEREVIQTI